MELENRFIVPLKREDAMQVLTDVPRIAPCIPGASLNGEENGVFSGQANVRLGPVALSFSGTASITSIDQNTHTAQVKAQGADKKGRGQAEATMTFVLEEADNSQTEVIVRTDVLLSGSIAQYGRASGLINVVAGQIVSEFSENLKKDILDKQEQGLPYQETKQLNSELPISGAKKEKINEPTVKKETKNELNLLALLIAIIKNWFSRTK